MMVKELIEFLQKQPQDLLVAYKLHSEYCLMQKDWISIVECCMPREDDWIHEKRPDKPSRKYLMFPGN